MAVFKRLLRCYCQRKVKQFFTLKGWPWETEKERTEEPTQPKKEEARGKAKRLFHRRLPLRKGKSILQAIPEEARALIFDRTFTVTDIHFRRLFHLTPQQNLLSIL